MELKLLPPELDAFLADVRRTLPHDGGNTFPKVVVYLFQFYHAYSTTHPVGDETGDARRKRLASIAAVVNDVVQRKKSVFARPVVVGGGAPVPLPEEMPPGDATVGDWAAVMLLDIVVKRAEGALEVVEQAGTITAALELLADVVLATARVKPRRIKHIVLGHLLRTVNRVLSHPSPDALALTIEVYTTISDAGIPRRLRMTAAETMQLASFGRKLWFVASAGIASAPETVDTSLTHLLLNQVSVALQGLLAAALELAVAMVCEALSLLVKGGPALVHTAYSVAYAILKLSGVLASVVTPIVETAEEIAMPNQVQLAVDVAAYLVKPLQSALEATATPFDDTVLDALKGQLLSGKEMPWTSLAAGSLTARSTFSFSHSTSTATLSSWLEGTVSANSAEEALVVLQSARHFPCTVAGDYAEHHCRRCEPVPLKKNEYSGVDRRRPLLASNPLMLRFFDIVLRRWSASSNDVVLVNLLIVVYSVCASWRLGDRRSVVTEWLGQWLAHDNRDVRMQAARIAPLVALEHVLLDQWLVTGPEGTVRVHNVEDEFASSRDPSSFVPVFEVVTKRLADPQTPRHWGEALVQTLINTAIACDPGREIGAVMTTLLLIFGSRNEQWVNYAHVGMLQIAMALKMTPQKLVMSVLPQAAVTTLSLGTAGLSRLLGLLRWERRHFLGLVADYAVPHFLDDFKNLVVDDIAQALSISKGKLIVKALGPVVAYHLVAPDFDEDHFLGVLKALSQRFADQSLGHIVRTSSDLYWHILMQLELVPRARVVAALERALEAANDEKSNGAHRSHGTSELLTQAKQALSDKLLSIVQRCSDTVHDIKGTRLVLSKIAALRALEFLVEEIPHTITVGLGQISTCLEACLLMLPLFQHLALCGWRALVTKVGLDRMLSLVDTMMLGIFQIYSSLEAEATQKVAVAILDEMYRLIVSKYPQFVPYVWLIPSHLELSAKVIVQRPELIPRSQVIEAFCRRLATRNDFVVEQALLDIDHYFRRYQQAVFDDLWRDHDQVWPHVVVLVQRLLAVASSYPQAAASCLGAIGTLDPSRFDIKKISDPATVLLHHFDDAGEVRDWVRQLMEDLLVPFFWSLPPNRQLFYAYAMQLMLEYGPSINEYLALAQATLRPLELLNYLGPPVKSKTVAYPVWGGLTRSFDTWITTVTVDLFRRALSALHNGRTGGSPARVIMYICLILIRDRAEAPLCQFLFRYICMVHVVNDLAVDDLTTDFATLLQLESPVDELEKLAVAEVFTVLDYFHQWQLLAQMVIQAKDTPQAVALRLRAQLKRVSRFTAQFHPPVLARKAAACQLEERTILIVEQGFHTDRKDMDEFVPVLQQMYAAVGDYESLNGVLQVFSLANLKGRLKLFQYNQTPQNWSLALALFSLDADGETERLRLLCDHGNYHQVLAEVDGHTLVAPDHAAIALEAAVNAGQFESLPKWLLVVDTHRNTHDDVVAATARALIAAETSRELDVEPINALVGAQLVPATLANFSVNLPLLRHLHRVYDAELVKARPAHGRKVVSHRLSHVAPKDQWHVLVFLRVAQRLAGDKDGEEGTLVKMANWARCHDRLDLAATLIVEAMGFGGNKTNLEYAKLLWDQGRQPEALDALRKIIDTLEDHPDKWVQLQYAKWLDELAHLLSAQIITQYERALQLGEGWSDAHYELANYYNKVLESQTTTQGLYEVYIVRHLLFSLAYDGTYLCEAVPKALTIWLDFAQLVYKQPTDERLSKLKVINNNVSKTNQKKQSWITQAWYVGLSQLLARMAHPQRDTYEVMHSLLARVILDRPQQALWQVLSHLKLTDPERKTRVDRLLRDPEFVSKHGDTLRSAQKLVEQLIKLAKFKPPKAWRGRPLFSLMSDFGVLGRVLGLVVPVHRFLETNAKPVMFEGIEDLVRIFWSQQAPRRITIRGSDGNTYNLMVKCDDTRKDAKVVEFTTAVNRYLHRELEIANYAVVPLSPQHGVIEFVENVETLKAITVKQRIRMGLAPIHEQKTYAQIQSAQKQGPQKGLEVYQALTKKFPPVLHAWYIHQFADPALWFEARTQYVRLLAVMLMVGYYVGLGDRHCENVLLFTRTGGVLHIDFECLFDKGITLPVPEIVPFRLTQNLIDAMGICGTEGKFRATCESVGHVIRDHEAPLMNILEALIHDPLLDWKLDLDLEQKTSQLTTVRRRVRGLMSLAEEIPLNVQGQVDKLIQEARSAENLSKMFCGWAPFV